MRSFRTSSTPGKMLTSNLSTDPHFKRWTLSPWHVNTYVFTEITMSQIFTFGFTEETNPLMVQLSFTVEPNSLIKGDAVTFLVRCRCAPQSAQAKKCITVHDVNFLKINIVQFCSLFLKQSCRDRRQIQGPHFQGNWKLKQHWTYCIYLLTHDEIK